MTAPVGWVSDHQEITPPANFHHFRDTTAITSDPDYAPAYAHGVRCLLAALAVGYRNRLREWLEKLPDWLSRAERMQGSTIRLAICSAIWTYIQRRHESLLRETVSDLLAKAPFDPDLLCLGGWSYVWLGQPARAIECFRKFEQVGRFNALAMAMRAGLATAMVQAERDAAAAEQARTIIANTREFAVPFRALAAALAHQGKRAEAREAANEALRLNPGDTLSAFQKRSGFIDNEPNRRFFDGLRAAGYPDA